MLITRLGGIGKGDVLDLKESVFTFWEANGNIDLGAPIIHDAATNDNSFNQDGLLVIAGDADLTGAEHRILGVFQGVIPVFKAGQTGSSSLTALNTAGTTTTGVTTTLTGFQAGDGDIIKAQSYGAGYARVIVVGGTTIDHGDILTLDTTAGRLEAGTNLTTGAGGQIWSLGKSSLAAEAAMKVFIRCL